MPTSRFVVRSTIGLLSVAFAILVFIVCANIWLGERAQNHFDAVIDARDIRSASVRLKEGLLAAESSQRGYVLTGNEIYLAPFDTAKVVARTGIERLTQLLSGMRERSAMLSRLRQVVTDKISEMEASIAFKKDGRDREALAMVETNRGKALMDEANVFITALVLRADAVLTDSVAEQRANATWLRWTSIAGGVLILLVVGTVIVTVHRYTSEITAARDQVRLANESLERRVIERTKELALARDRAEVLLTEVNHRVANSLSLVGSLVRLQSGAVADAAAKSALAETQARIQAIAQMHKHLYTSGDVARVSVDTYLGVVLSQLEAALTADGTGVRLHCAIEPVELPTSESINVGIIVTEWVTNAFKYAYADRKGDVRVRLHRSESRIEVLVEDDGVGRDDLRSAQGTGLGTRIVSVIAASMAAEVSYRGRQPGTEAKLVLNQAAA